MKELLISEFKFHPKAQLIDYYKLFYQDAFGPGHAIKDKASAESYLRAELAEASKYEEIDFQNISYLNNFYRVNINIINKGIISFDNFLNAFLKSAEMKNNISYNEWIEHWKNIEKQILIMKIPIENIKQQSADLLNLINRKQLVSHSKIYKENYNPHYRLINSDLLKNNKSFNSITIK